MLRIRRKSSFRVQFGDDIVFEILTWVPAKSLMRFKCVCKGWNTLIQQDPDFVKSHIARSHARPSAIHLFFEMVVRFRYPKSYELEGSSLKLTPHHYSDTRPSEMIICSNQCNGLVCLKNSSSGVYLYNVTTREIKALPSSLINFSGHFSKLFLGFDKFTEKYKLLHVLFYKIEILTLGTNSWREIKLIPEKSSLSYYTTYCIFLDGLLYWRSENMAKNRIEYFDFREEKYGILSSKYRRNIIKMIQYWPFLERYKKRHLISDKVKVLMKYTSDDPNSDKLATLELREERIYNTDQCVLVTTSYISAPATLVFPPCSPLRHASSFVENIIPLSFTDVKV